MVGSASYLRGEHTGGAEKQIGLLAKHLERRGHDVVIVEPNRDRPDEIIDTIRIVRAWEKYRGGRGIRLFTYRIPSLKRALTRISADVYYTRSGSYTTNAVITTAKKIGAVAILGLASDRDLYSDSGKVLFATNNKFTSQLFGKLAYMFFYAPALRKADWVIAQNMAQVSRCEELGLANQLIPSIVGLPAIRSTSVAENTDVIWVGNIDREARRSKGFDQLVTITQRLANVRFEIVGLLNKTVLNRELEVLGKSKNVRLTGKLSQVDTLAAIARAKLVINTSPSEGFSNVFLEAWSLGKPVITLYVNPNGLLREDGLGYCACGDVGSMIDAILFFLKHENQRRQTGERGRAYIEAIHDPDVVCQRYELLFKKRE